MMPSLRPRESWGYVKGDARITNAHYFIRQPDGEYASISPFMNRTYPPSRIRFTKRQPARNIDRHSLHRLAKRKTT